MPFQGPLVAGLGLAGIFVVAPPSRALAPAIPAAPALLQAKNAQDAAGNDEYNYIAGLFEKGFHELVVTEAKKFLQAHPEHPRVPLVRYRLGQSLFESKKY